MAQHITIRPAQRNDYPAIDRLGRLVQEDHAAAHPEMFRAGTTALTEGRCIELLANPRARLLVAEDEQEIAGLMVMECREAPNYPVFEPRTVVMVEVLIVEPEAQGRGVGRMLMDAARDWARELGAVAVELSVFEFNTDAIGFYEHLGFSTLRRTMVLPVDPAIERGVPGEL